MYIDNISTWENERNKIELFGVRGAGLADTMYWLSPTFGFIDYPPEEWVISDPSSSHDVVLSKIAAAQHKVTYPAGNAGPFDISGIYESPTAKTLVIYNPSIDFLTGNTYANTQLTNARIMVNGEILGARLYKLALFDWSNRVNQTSGGSATGNAIAKTLTKTIAVSNIITTYDILDAFPGYAQISEATYVQMSNQDINDRANALMDYAAAQDGQTKYRKNNEVLE
jgi:hypothetical protein